MAKKDKKDQQKPATMKRKTIKRRTMKRKEYEHEMRTLHGELVVMREWVIPASF